MFKQRRTHRAGSTEELAARTEDDRWLRLVCGSAKRALYGQAPAALRAYSFAVDQDRKRIRLRAHFSESPSEDDLEAISAIETEIDGDFLDHFEGETDSEVAATGTTPALLSGGVAYLREGEPGTTCCE